MGADRKKIFIGIVVVAIIVLLLAFGGRDVVPEGEKAAPEAPKKVAPQNNVQTPGVPKAIDYNQYNYDFVDENVKGVLNGILGPNGKVAFYLPPTGYINVSKGDGYGVAFALNNPNPSGENRFEYDFVVDNSVVKNCGVSEEVAQSWIQRGWTSWGKIGEGWIDHMTVYFAFPNDTPSCNLKYNFKIMKDGTDYATQVIEFNIV